MIFGDEFEMEAENEETLVRRHVSAVASLVNKLHPCSCLSSVMVLHSGFRKGAFYCWVVDVLDHRSCVDEYIIFK